MTWGKYLWKLIFYDGHCAIIQFKFNVCVLILDYNMGYFMA